MSEDLQGQVVTKLTTDPSNARLHGSRNREMIADSLDRFGAVRPIIIDGDNVVHAGNATYAEAEALGIPVEVIESDGSKLYAIRMTNLTPEQFREYGLIDNQSALLATWNTDELRKRLESGDDLSQVWETQELAQLVADQAESFDPMAEWEGMPEFEHEDERPAKQVIVSFVSESDLERFARLVEQNVLMTTKSIWFPERRLDSIREKAYISDES